MRIVVRVGFDRSVESDGELAIAGRKLTIGVDDISPRGIKAHTSFVQPCGRIMVRHRTRR
jgi:hypothetical protein